MFSGPHARPSLRTTQVASRLARARFDPLRRLCLLAPHDTLAGRAVAPCTRFSTPSVRQNQRTRTPSSLHTRPLQSGATATVLDVPSEECRLRTHLERKNHDLWGFVIYRCTYDDEKTWEKVSHHHRTRPGADCKIRCTRAGEQLVLDVC